MHYHLHKRQKACPAIENDIELTDEIKDKIMKNRIYKIPKDPQRIVNQTINNINMMNNFISSMDPVSKITKLVNYNNATVVPFEKVIENTFDEIRYKLDDDPHDYELRENRLYEIVDEATRINSSNPIDYNLLFDSKQNKIILLDDTNKWREMILSSGVRAIVNLIKDYFWDSYEKYLIRKIKNDKVYLRDRTRCLDRLEEYYMCLGALDIPPYVKERCDGDVFHNDNMERDICDEFENIYEKNKSNMTSKEKAAMNAKLKDMFEAVKSNCKNNVSDLNKLILKTIQVDEEFQRQLIDVIETPNL